MQNKACIVLFFMLVGITGIALTGQDLHYSQFYYNYHNLSPSTVGQFDGNDRVTLNYKNQWLSLPVPYNTVSFFYDGNRSLRNSKSGYGFGFGLDYDRAGDSKLNMAKLCGVFSYSHYIDKKNRIILGVSPAVAQRRLSSEGLRWDRQWDGDKYNPNISPNENFASTGDFFLDLSAGLTYEFKLTERTRISLNGATFHLNKPNQSFYGINDQFINLPIRYSLSANISVGIFSFLDVVLAGNYQTQEKYKETLGSGLLRLRVNRTPGSILNLLAGCNIRMHDALIPTAGVEYKNWLVSLSYDINTSFFQIATNKKGGPEFAVQYVFAKVKKSGIYKKCPIY